MTRDGASLAHLARRHDAGFFEGTMPRRDRVSAARREPRRHVDRRRCLCVRAGARSARRLADRRRHARASSTTASARMRSSTKASTGVHFAVWAPNARRVSVVGDFNALGRPPPRDAQARRHRRLGDLRPGARRRHALQVRDRRRRRHAACRSRPIPSASARSCGRRPRRSCATPTRFALDRRRLDGGAGARAIRGARRCRSTRCISARGGAATATAGSPTTSSPTRSSPTPPTWASRIVELMPVNEHPLDARGATSRSGSSRRRAASASPPRSRASSIAAIGAGLGVILDWVPAHFPVDPHGLAQFDGTALYEHADPRLGFHPDWNTAIFNFGRTRGRELPHRERALLARPLPRRRAARRRRRVDALPRLLAQGGRMAAQPLRRQREPRGGRLPAQAQRSGVRAASGRDHDRRGIDGVAGGVAADLRRRPGLRLQVEHGLDARHARIPAARTRCTGAGTTTR